MTSNLNQLPDESLYHQGSVNPNAIPEGEENLFYDRGVEEYEQEFNNLNPNGDPLFSVEDWKGTTVLDIGAGGNDRFGMEARAQGVRVVSVNPALGEASSRARLNRAVARQNQENSQAVDNEYNALSAWRKVIQKRREYSPIASESVAALGQALPIRDESVDAVVSVYGVPHYLHHVDPSLRGTDAITAYTPDVRAKDKALIGQAFEEILRVLKPGGKAFLKDDHRKPGSENIPSGYSPSDGSEVIEVLRGLPGVKAEIYEQDMPVKNSLFIDYSQVSGMQRCIVLTKLEPGAESSLTMTEYPMQLL